MSRIRTNPLALAAVVAVLATALAVPAALDVAAPAAAGTGAIEAPDFATEVYGDPWDFSNPADTSGMMVVQNRTVGGGTTLAHSFPGPSAGALSFPAHQFTYLYLVRSWGTGALSVGRDGGHVPIDADTYDVLSFRATVSPFGAASTGAAVFWQTCIDDHNDSCAGGQPFALLPGTHTYSIPLQAGPFPSRPADWSGQVNKLLLNLNSDFPAEYPTVSLDWVRLHSGSSGTSDDLPPGTWPLTSGGSATVTARPHPVVVDPDLAGGQDYASTVRGDPWDMNSLNDLSFSANAELSVVNGQVRGVSAGPTLNDPQVRFTMPEHSLNTRRWHRLTMRVGAQGGFGLDNVPGEGMVGRFIWSNDAIAPDYAQETNDIVVYPTSQTIQLDLHTWPPSAINDDEIPVRQGWGGPGSRRVSRLRWDPHEDPGRRVFWIDDVRLARNDIANPVFAVRWRDDAWMPGTTADIYLSTTKGSGGFKVTGTPLDMQAGENAWNLDARNLPENHIYWVKIVVNHPNGQSATAWSSGPVETGTPVEFTDVVPGDLFFWDVFWLVKAGIANGVTADAYQPTQPVRRDQMAAFLDRMTNGGSSPACAAAPFPDVQTNHLFCRSIAWAADSGVATGTGSGYSPSGVVTRDQMAAFLYRLSHEGASAPPCTSAPFSDVPTSSPLCGYVAWMADSGITSGCAAGRYCPGKPVARQEMAKFLKAFAQ